MEVRQALVVWMLFHALAFAQTSLASHSTQPVFPAIFAFGDSLTDTGNYLISQNDSVYQAENHLPYGITFFHRPTGRFCDGRLAVDFIAQRLRAPLLKPSLSLLRSHFGPPAFEDRFVNFAVAGATAQSAFFLENSQGIVPITQYSLGVQLKWLKDLLAGAKEVHLPKSLIYFAEIGGNDYNYAFAYGKSVVEVLNSIPNVTAQIKKALQTLINYGAKYIVVESNMPMGCGPAYIKLLNSAPKNRFGCVKEINEIGHTHNKLLKKVIRQVAMKYPHVSIVYLDLEKAYNQVLKRPSVFGFTNTTGACFDVLLFLNPKIPFNLTAFQEVKACPQPSQYVNWDGVHLTEAMYKTVTNLFLDEGFAQPYPNFLTKRLS